MNPRYHVFTHDSLCGNSVSSSLPEDRISLTTTDSRPLPPPRSLSPPLLVRVAMKISRSRCYAFLRRVFHYQNGSGSDLGPNPFDSKKWMFVEFMALITQISLTAYTLITSKTEKPVWPMRIWLSGYAFGCFLSVAILLWRYRLAHHSHDDIEQQHNNNNEESRSLQCMQRCRASIELIFAIWFVMGNVWIFDSRFGSYHRAPKLHVLCISLLAWNAVSYSFPFILFVLLCCCVPLLSALLGYNMNTASIQRGASEEQLAGLPSWKYKDADYSEDPECCICLAKYKDKEEIRQLPCDHIFHLKCVDQWLRIISCCPLCKQGIDK
ncbi:E3 ubiquitin-protein ligase At4g11680-like [Andrographis paniculata]|uniref:E3 ubiquitin-protein ligase At4g11680-like n=1 Tax=Andrographis paniculata TaxID=175694 RepID=UPI0021E8C76F|nr:E3 ubiquitin-protein ligase At4g11680-like [Andrographis paniculata]